MLYKRWFSLPYLRCLKPEEGHHVLEEPYAGEYSKHIKVHSLYIKALRLGYFWPTMKSDAKSLVRKYERCQKNAHIEHSPSSNVHCLTSPWPSTHWGFNVLEPLSISIGQRKFILATCDYFIQQVEADDIAKVTKKNV